MIQVHYIQTYNVRGTQCRNFGGSPLLSPEQETPIFPNANLFCSTLPPPESRVSGCQQDFVDWPLKRLPVWLSWSECHPVHGKVRSSIPSQERYLRCKFDSWSGCVWEATNWCFSLSPCLSLSLSLSPSPHSLNKHILRWGLKAITKLIKRGYLNL